MGFIRIVSFLSYIDTTYYIITITVLFDDNTNKYKMVLLICTEYPGNACYGSAAKRVLEKDGYEIGGRYHHYFHDM